MSLKFENEDVLMFYQSLPAHVCDKLLEVRALIGEVALEIEPLLCGVSESLKWGEPSYRLRNSKIGTAIRLGFYKKSPQQFKVLFHCRTHLIDSFRQQYGNVFQYEKNRALIFDIQAPLPKRLLKECFYKALTYT